VIALIQRVSEARVTVGERVTGEIGAGLLALVCAERGDSEQTCDRLVERVLAYRVFGDESGRMNRSLRDTGGGLLVVSQFTLAADTDTGNRPSFTPAADPATGEALYERFVAQARAAHPAVATGEFRAHMRVALVNDGPVTLTLRVRPQQIAAAR
jgi:D-tyrosyl-tRNA(Tyr) deacylase